MSPDRHELRYSSVLAKHCWQLFWLETTLRRSHGAWFAAVNVHDKRSSCSWRDQTVYTGGSTDGRTAVVIENTESVRRAAEPARSSYLDRPPRTDLESCGHAHPRPSRYEAQYEVVHARHARRCSCCSVCQLQRPVGPSVCIPG